MDDKRIRAAIVNAVHAGRLARNWTVADLAKKIGRGLGDISLFESGRIFDLNDVRNLANTLEIKASDIATQTTGERVRVARYLAGLNQTQTVDRTGMLFTNVTLSGIERDVTSIDVLDDNQVGALAKLLHVSVEWLKELEQKQVEMPLDKPESKQLPCNHAVRVYIGSAIKKAREDGTISEQELAMGMGVSITTVSTIEIGNTLTNAKCITAALTLLGIDRNALLKGYFTKPYDYGSRITLARLTQERSKSEIKKVTGISEHVVESWGSNTRKPTVGGLEALANACDVSAEWLKTGKGEPIPEKAAQIATISAEPVETKRVVVAPERKRTELFDITVAAERNAAGTTFKALSYDEFLAMLKLAKKADNVAFVELHE